MSSKPTVIFVPGAWHGPEAFSQVSSILENAGYHTVSIALASVNASQPLTGFEPDVDRIRAAVQQTCDAGQDVILFMHSYGSIPAFESIKGLTKAARQQAGKQGGVTRLFFCCAFVLPEGGSLIGALGGKPLPWFIVEDDEMVVHASTPEKIFYNDLDEKTAAKWVSALKPFSYKTFSSKVTYAGWRDVPSTYLFCEKDQAIPLEAQKGMVQGSGVNFDSETLDASHSPFLSMPEKVAEAVRRSAGE